MILPRAFILIAFSVLLYMSGCSTVGSSVQAGRNALQTNRPNDAVGYLVPAAAANPNYKIPYRIQLGVLSYLGRAYLETGNTAEARRTLQQAVELDSEDPLAHLYLGIALLKTGQHEQGRKEIGVGLRAISNTLNYIAEDRVYGFYWDPGMQIRDDIQRSLAANLNDADLVVAAERAGRALDEEIDKARRDEARRSGGSDSGSGGS